MEALAKQTRSLVESLRNTRIHTTKEQYDILKALGLEISKAATYLPLQVEALQSRHTESEEGRKLVAQADSAREDLIATCRLKNRTTFGRNIVLFFEGPKGSPLDSEAVKARKKLTRERCERISGLNPNAVISWAAAFTPSLWTANLMSRNTFDHIMEHIEPEDASVWPSEVRQILHALGTEEPLQRLKEYHDFLRGTVYIDGTIEKLMSDQFLRIERVQQPMPYSQRNEGTSRTIAQKLDFPFKNTTMIKMIKRLCAQSLRVGYTDPH